MPSALREVNTKDFMDPINLVQLADGTAIFADNIKSLQVKFESLFQFSSKNTRYQIYKKTKYCHFSDRATFEPVRIDTDCYINSVDKTHGYKYLGMVFYPTNNMKEIILKHLNRRSINISKLYGWSNVNDDTPFEIKLMIVGNCVISSMLYGAETWGDIYHVEHMLIDIEMKALKAILKVKKGTTNDLVLHELRRCSIISKIKDLQYKFFEKISQLQPLDAIISSVIEMCENSPFIAYYKNLISNNCERDILDREKRIMELSSSMRKNYRDQNFHNKCCIYNSFLNDYYRHQGWRCPPLGI